MNMMKWICGLPLLLLCSCRSDDVVATSSIAVASPSIVSYGSYVGINVAQQYSAISMGLPGHYYAELISGEELTKKVNSIQNYIKSLPDYWMYMGDRDAFHYVAFVPAFGARKIYRIKASEYSIEEVFPLTAKSSAWQCLSSTQYRYDELDVYNMGVIQIQTAGPKRSPKKIPLRALSEHWNFF